MSNKKYKLKKTINELVDDTLSMIHGDDKHHTLSNVFSKKTLDSTIGTTTQPFSWNRRLGFGAEYYGDASFSVSEEDDKLNKNDNSIEQAQKELSEQKALNMIEDILSKRSNLRDINTLTSIPEFDVFQKEHPIISKYLTMVTDKIKDKKEEIGEFGATILNSIIDSFDVDKIPFNVKKILINKLKGIRNNGI